MRIFFIAWVRPYPQARGLPLPLVKQPLALLATLPFFHSGITGLINAVFNKHDLLLVILDNGTTAMTGHQPNPGVVPEVLGDASVHIDIASVVQGCGVTQMAKVRPFNLRATLQTLEEMALLACGC